MWRKSPKFSSCKKHQQRVIRQQIQQKPTPVHDRTDSKLSFEPFLCNLGMNSSLQKFLKFVANLQQKRVGGLVKGGNSKVTED